jgi:nucleotide-binding universal stress UspA family protein
MENNISPNSASGTGFSPYKDSNKVPLEALQASKSTEPPIVWAIDAFPDQLELHIKSAAALQALFPKTTIYPVYVLSEESFTDRGFSTFLKPALKPMATKSLRRLISQIENFSLQADMRRHLQTHLEKPRVLVESSASRPACARKLLRFAEKIGAGQIALGSHARNGLSRLFIGSFSESLLDHSSLPVLVSGPRCNEMKSEPEVIVFPTDFAPSGDPAFQQVLSFAARTKAELHVFHKTTYAPDIFVQGGVQLLGGGWVTIDPYLSPEEHFDSQAQYWLNEAARRGVKTRIISENFREPTSQAIVEYVSHLGDRSALVAMIYHDTRVGAVTGALLGSVTRDVIRSSTCPVYLIPDIA